MRDEGHELTGVDFDLDDDRGAKHTSANTSSVRSGTHTRQSSGASGTSDHSSHSGKPVIRTWRDAFARLQSDFGSDPSSADMKVALLKFLEYLPPQYVAAAVEFVRTKREQNEAVNIDALGNYFMMLDQTSAEVRRLTSSVPSLSSSSLSSGSQHSYGSRKRSPLSLSRPQSPSSTRRSKLDEHLADFAPSRPNVYNLLHSKEDDGTDTTSQ
jgi:hypothetical protein